MNAYADITELPNHVIPPVDAPRRPTTRTEVLLFAAVAVFALLQVLAVSAFGLVALGVTAVIAVPVVMVLIVMITLG